MGDRILQLFFPHTLLSGNTSLSIVFYQTLISTAIIFLQSIVGLILNRKMVAKFEELNVHYHHLKMLFFRRPFGEHDILC